jgi:hypothetical protein
MSAVTSPVTHDPQHEIRNPFGEQYGNHESVAEQILQFAVVFRRKRRDVSATDSSSVVGKRDGAVPDRADKLAGMTRNASAPARRPRSG